jgi:glycosyltransferase involved in cell wall biosynthesis
LIEAMGRGALTLYLDTPENREVAADVAIPFTATDLTRKLEYTLSCSEEDRAALRQAAEERVQQRYSWDYVTQAYEHLFERLLA